MEGSANAREILPPALYDFFPLDADAFHEVPEDQRIPKEVQATFNQLVIYNSTPNSADPTLHGWLALITHKTQHIRMFTFGDGFDLNLDKGEATLQGRTYWCRYEWWGDTPTMSGLGTATFHFQEQGNYKTRKVVGYLRRACFVKTFLDTE